jgi:DNA repair protein RadC
LALSRASLGELRKFLSKRKAESLIAALRVSAYGEAKRAVSEPLDRPESLYPACLDMQMFRQEVLRVLLLNARFRLITSSDVFKGTLNESVAHPREIFRSVIVHSAYAFVLVHKPWPWGPMRLYQEKDVRQGLQDGK